MTSDSRERTRDDAEIFFARRLHISSAELNRGLTTRQMRRERVWLEIVSGGLEHVPLGTNKAGKLETYGEAFARIFGPLEGGAVTDELHFGAQEPQR